MPGVSSYFDHTSERYVMGQQVLTLGLSCEQGFVSLDSELFISQTKAQALHQSFQDGRSIVAKQQTKPEIVKPWFIVLYIAILKQIIRFLRKTTTKHLLLFN